MLIGEVNSEGRVRSAEAGSSGCALLALVDLLSRVAAVAAAASAELCRAQDRIVPLHAPCRISVVT